MFVEEMSSRIILETNSKHSSVSQPPYGVMCFNSYLSANISLLGEFWAEPRGVKLHTVPLDEAGMKETVCP